MPTIIIADDEPLLRFHLQKTLDDLWPEGDIIAQAANGEEALALISELQPDVAFLDIHMPGMTGLDVALHLAKQSSKTRIVFLTAYDEYAIEAFDRGAVDYLLKPLDENRLTKTIERLTIEPASQTKQEFDVQTLLDLVSKSAPGQQLTWLNAQQGDLIKVVHIDDALFFRAEDKYTTLVTREGEFLLRQSVKQLEAQLDESIFWRIHRSTLVNMRHVDRVERALNGQTLLYVNGLSKPLAVSRAKQYLFKAH